MSELEIRKVLVLSTAHLPPGELADYNLWTRIAEHDDGVYYYVPEELDTINDDLPPALAYVLRFAHRHGCQEVKFDWDGRIVDELPNFIDLYCQLT